MDNAFQSFCIFSKFYTNSPYLGFSTIPNLNIITIFLILIACSSGSPWHNLLQASPVKVLKMALKKILSFLLKVIPSCCCFCNTPGSFPKKSTYRFPKSCRVPEYLKLGSRYQQAEGQTSKCSKSVSKSHLRRYTSGGPPQSELHRFYTRTSLLYICGCAVKRCRQLSLCKKQCIIFTSTLLSLAP